MPQPVVVGVDGSRESLRAVQWATDDAARRKAPLRIVFVVAPWLVTLTPHHPYRQVGERLRLRSVETLVEAEETARQAVSELEVSTDLIAGSGTGRHTHAVPALVEEAAKASVIVLGSRGRGGFAGLLLGSVSLGVAGRGSAPTVVVREVPQQAPEMVVVGVDGSAHSVAAVGFAFEEAAARAARLLAVGVYRDVLAGHPAEALPDTLAQQEETEHMVAETVAGWSADYPDIPVDQQAVEGHPVAVLSEMSAASQLLVVGSRGRGVVSSVLLGSVSHGVLHHARSPVAVIPTKAG